MIAIAKPYPQTSPQVSWTQAINFSAAHCTNPPELKWVKKIAHRILHAKEPIDVAELYLEFMGPLHSGQISMALDFMRGMVKVIAFEGDLIVVKDRESLDGWLHRFDPEA